MIAPLYDLIYVLPLCQILILVAGPYAGIPGNSVLGCIVASLVVGFIQLLRYLSVKGKFIATGVGIALFVGVYFAIGKERFKEGINEYSWLYVCVLFAVLAYIVGVLAANKKLIRRLGGLAAFGTAIFLMIIKEPVAKFSAVMFFLIILICLAEEVQAKWEKSGYTKVKDHMVMLFPILFILCMFVMVVKAPDKPYDWKFFQVTWDKISSTFEIVLEWASKPSESYADIGFSGGSTFASDINGNDKDAMKVKIYSDNPSAIYLSGKMFDTFSEGTWESTIEDGENSRMMDAIELRAAVRKYDAKYEDDYIYKTKNDIESRMKSTKYIFTPSKAIFNKVAFTDIPYTENAGVVNSEDKIRSGDSYRVVYYKINMANDELGNLIDTAKPIDVEAWEDVEIRELQKKRPEFSYDEYQAYRKWIYDNYCQEDVASPKVQELLEEITEGETGAYEKMKAIEEYLKGFEYSTSPGVLPDYVKDSKSYLDYFLFESKKGYCVHYATAFVLLARECGMPARYVQGYRFKKENSEYVNVKETYSHSWAEVYFENVGWIAFEATPGYNNAGGWKVKKYSNEETSDKAGKGDGKPGKKREQTVVDDVTTEELDAVEIEEPIVKKAYISIRMIFIPVFAVLVFLCLYIMLSKAVSKRKYYHLNNDDKIKNLVSRNFRIFKILGYGISEYETLSEYKERLIETDNKEILEGLIFIDIYEDIIYADRAVDLDMVKQFEDTHDKFKRVLTDNKAIYKLFNL